mmetsp:Transcript_30036/g.64386  ORF Transcript_30036/g.64386 Transcript_30036/m.64386 type:complete len:638 (+) Transcript_30036:135-2048(+)
MCSHSVLKVLELALHLIDNIGILPGDIRGAGLGINVLSINHLLNNGSETRLDMRISKLGIRRRIRNRLLAKIVKGDNDGKHAHGLGEGAGKVIVREGVLREEILADELGHFHDNLLIFGERLFSNELHNLGEVILLLEDGARLVTEVRVARVHVVEVRLQNLHVFGVGDEPVERRKVLSLSKLLVQPPKDLDDGESGGGDGIGEISSGGRDGPNDSDGTLAIGRSETGHATGSLVEGSETGSEVGGISGIGGHLSESTRDLAKGFGPSRGGVPHHGHVHSLVAEILGEGDTGVDGSFAGSHRHVGSVGDQSGAFHDPDFLFLAGLVFDGHGQLGEIAQHFRHLVSALAASDVDDDVGVGELGERLGNDRLSASKRSGDGAGSSQNGREETVDDAKTRDEGDVSGQLLGDGTRTADGPKVAQGQVVGSVLALVVHLHHDVVHQESLLAIRAGGVDLGHGSVDVGRHQDAMGMDDLILVHDSHDVSPGDGLPLLDVGRGEGPPHIPRQTRNVHTLGHVDVSALLEDALQRTLDPIENRPHDSGSQLDGQRLLLPQDGISHGQAGGVLVDLDGGRVALELDDLADELGVAHADEFVHGRAGHAVGDDEGAGHFEDEAVVVFFFFRHGDCWVGELRYGREL